MKSKYLNRHQEASASYGDEITDIGCKEGQKILHISDASLDALRRIRLGAEEDELGLINEKNGIHVYVLGEPSVVQNLKKKFKNIVFEAAPRKDWTDLISNAVSQRVSKLNKTLSSLYLENGALKTEITNLCVLSKHLESYIDSASLNREFVFLELPGLKGFNRAVGQELTQKLPRLPCGTTEIQLFSSSTSNTADELVFTIESTAGSVATEIKLKPSVTGWFGLRLNQPVIASHNSYLIRIRRSTTEKDKSKSFRPYFALSGRLSDNLLCMADGEVLDSSLAMRIVVGPPRAPAFRLEGDMVWGSRVGVSPVSLSKSIGLKVDDSNRKMTAKTTGANLILQIGDVSKLAVLTMKRDVFFRDDQYVSADHSGVCILDFKLSHDELATSPELANIKCALLVQDKSEKVDDRKSFLYYMTKNGWNLSVISNVTRMRDSEYINLLLVTPMPLRNVEMEINSVRFWRM